MENWKEIKGYEGIYEISNKGRVRTAENKVTYSELHGKRVWKQRVLKLKTDKNGYKRVSLWKNKQSKDFLVHRLVADAFIEKEKKKDLVNHKDGNPSNNYKENLEWCTAKGNVEHAFQNGLMTTQNSIVLMNTNTNECKYFLSMARASEFLGRNKGFLSSLLKRGETTVDEYEIFIKVKKEAV